MKFINSIFLFSLFGIQTAMSQTIIGQNSSIFGTLTKSASPYYVKGNIYVPKDSTLIIEPGVQIRFDGKFQLSVYGNIRAIGVEGDTIRFYPLDTNNRWKGIRYFGRSKAKDSAVFKYCKFEYCGPKLSNFESALTLKRGHFKVENCVFRNNTTVIGANSINCDSALSLFINKCYFYKNWNINKNSAINQQVYGAVGITSGEISNCIFEWNISRNPYNSQDEISLFGNGSGGILNISSYNTNSNVIKVNNCKFINNQCALRGSGIDLFAYESLDVQIDGCYFERNVSGRYGVVSHINSTNSTQNGKIKLVVSDCVFKNNTSINESVFDGNSCVTIITPKATDTVIIKGTLFDGNIGRTTVKLAAENQSNYFLIGNTFTRNALWCISAEYGTEIFSINNLYYNNLALNILDNNTAKYHLKSINDAFLFNGSNSDTLVLNSKLLRTYEGLFYLIDPSFQMTNSGTFKNCIFWGNRDFKNRIRNLSPASGPVYEVSNCIFEGNPDSSIMWVNEYNQPRPNPIVQTWSNNINVNPSFVKNPLTFGPKGYDSTCDFRLNSTCTKLSPAYNKGLNNALASWAGYTDFMGNARVNCDTIDIGPYEVQQQVNRVQILNEPKDSAYCDNLMEVQLKTTCNPNTSFAWQKLQGSSWSNIPNAQTSTYQSTTPSAGTYRAIYSQNDCQIADTSRSFVVNLRPSPKPNIGKDTTIEQKASLTLNAGSYSTYQWQDNSVAKTYTVKGNTQGIGKKTYWVKVSGNNGCYGTDSITISVTWNSSLETLLKQGWNIYPNPTKDVLQIASKDRSSYNWSVFNINGLQILTGNEADAINLSSLPQGVYFVRIQSEGVDEMIKVSKIDK
jgi:hypothetical protein